MNTYDIDKAFAEHIPCWGDITENDRLYLCENTRLLSFKRGETVHDGNECTGVFFIKSGCLRVYILSDEGREVTLYRLFPGDICMLSASCVLQAITFDVVIDSEDDTECLLIPAGPFGNVSDNVDVLKLYAQDVALTRFSEVMWVFQQILFMSFDRRLAIFLYEESSNTGNDTIKLTHEQIAKYMGSAREVVSRMLKYFRADGIVELSRGGITIIDKKKLKNLALEH